MAISATLGMAYINLRVKMASFESSMARVTKRLKKVNSLISKVTKSTRVMFMATAAIGVGFKVGALAFKAGALVFRTAMAGVFKILEIVNSLIKTIAKNIKRMFLAAVAYAGIALKAFGSFEKAMRRATAVSEATEKQFVKMSKMAADQSVRLNMAATKTATAFYFLGSAGLNVTEQMQAYIPVATLAKAATIEMGEAAEMVVDTMKGFQIGFKRTAYVTDVMAEAVTSSNMTFSQLGNTLSMISGVANMTNNSLADTVTLVAKMADVGIKGTRAGTSMRRSLLNLAAPTSAISLLMKKYNVAVFDTEGRMKPMIRLVGELSEVLQHATEAERNMAFRVIFGARAIAGQIAVFNTGRVALEKFSKRLDEAGGAAQRIADKQMKAFSERIGQVWQRIQRTTRAIGETLAPAFLRLAIGVGKAAEKLREFVTKHKYAIMAYTEVIAARLKFLGKVIYELAKYITTDFTNAWRTAFNAIAKAAKPFGEILVTVWEKIAEDSWAVFDKMLRKMRIAMFKFLAQRAKWLMLSPAVAIAFSAMMAAEISAMKKMKKRTATTSWGEVGTKIAPKLAEIWDTLGDILPKHFKDILSKHYKNLSKEELKIIEFYAGRQLEVEKAAAAIKSGISKGKMPVGRRGVSPAAAGAKVGFMDVAAAWQQVAIAVNKPLEKLAQDQLKELVKQTKTGTEIREMIRDFRIQRGQVILATT